MNPPASSTESIYADADFRLPCSVGEVSRVVFEARNLSPRQLEILQHALGVDQYGHTPKGFTPYTRNYFAAGAADEPTCRELVAMAYMVQYRRSEVYPDYNCAVTEAGKKAMHEASLKPPKLTRSQSRYQRFLDADSGMSFNEWLRCGR